MNKIFEFIIEFRVFMKDLQVEVFYKFNVCFDKYTITIFYLAFSTKDNLVNRQPFLLAIHYPNKKTPAKNGEPLTTPNSARA